MKLHFPDTLTNIVLSLLVEDQVSNLEFPNALDAQTSTLDLDTICYFRNIISIAFKSFKLQTPVTEITLNGIIHVYQKMWLQVWFPAHIWIIAAFIILAS